MADYLKEYEHLQKEEFGYVKGVPINYFYCILLILFLIIENVRDVYMILYNLLQFVGFIYCLSVIAVLYYRDGYHDIQQTLYDSIGSVIKLLHFLKYLEVYYSARGYIRSNAIILFIEITDRNFILFIVIDIEQRILHHTLTLFPLYLIWSLIEILR